MKIFCIFSQEYDVFLKAAVKYTLAKYEDQLELSNLKEIELVDKNIYKLATDGKTCNNGEKIIVTSRLYEMLPSLTISDIEDNINFRLIINTLYHEMGHVTDWLHMPKIYDAASKHPTTEEGTAALFWIEYLAQKRSHAEWADDYDELCDGFAKRTWLAYKNDLNRISTDNFRYLLKVMPYFMARTQKPGIREKYFSIMPNALLKEFIVEMDKQLKILEAEAPFDDLYKLAGIYKTANRYYKIFKRKYDPQTHSPSAR